MGSAEEVGVFGFCFGVNGREIRGRVCSADGGEGRLLARDLAAGGGFEVVGWGDAGKDRVHREGVERLHGLGLVAEESIDPETAGVGVLGGEATGQDGGLDEGFSPGAGL